MFLHLSKAVTGHNCCGLIETVNNWVRCLLLISMQEHHLFLLMGKSLYNKSLMVRSRASGPSTHQLEPAPGLHFRPLSIVVAFAGHRMGLAYCFPQPAL